ncbi:MAG: DNA topoisomerase, partial [Ruminiclostridium sp.]|nr:DNA topoisomerase [Ruminiclostridium sp.]
TEVVKESKRELPPLLYDLTELQRDANRRYGYSAKQTLNIMQRLYESHKLVTYPRTDSRYITTDIFPTLTERLKSVSTGPYAKTAQTVLKYGFSSSKRFVDNSKVTDHHAIIPTEQYVNLSSLNQEERHIYDLIVKRFLAILSPSFEYEQTTVKIKAADEIFTARGKIVKAMGWKEIYSGNIDTDEEDNEEDKEQSLPDIKKGITGKMENVRIVNGKTKPPARYTEATLLSAMEHPGKFVDNKVFRDALESSSGLGTPATRADIIEKLFNTFYIERSGKDIYPTSKGIQLIDLVPDDLKSPEMTGKWEQQLSFISTGKVNPKSFISNMREYAGKLVSNVISSNETFKHDNITREKCQCGKYLLEVNGKRGKMLVCPDRECGFRKMVSQTTNARCPECHKKMELRGEGDKKTFYCSCGYRERLENFQNRKEDKVNKKDVNTFLGKQNTDENINSALAEALSKWKEKK